MYSKLFALTLLGVISLTAEASFDEVVPESYYFDQETDVGRFEYHDYTGFQLIDGVYGGEAYSLDLGNGNAYEWVGWRGNEIVNIDFFFNAEIMRPINEIRVGVSQSRTDDVVFPDLHILSSKDGKEWSLLDSIINPESNAYNNTKGVFTFAGLELSTNDYVRVSATWNDNGPWTFIDEIDFYSVSSPSLAFILSLSALVFIRNKSFRFK